MTLQRSRIRQRAYSFVLEILKASPINFDYKFESPINLDFVDFGHFQKVLKVKGRLERYFVFV